VRTRSCRVRFLPLLPSFLPFPLRLDSRGISAEDGNLLFSRHLFFPFSHVKPKSHQRWLSRVWPLREPLPPVPQSAFPFVMAFLFPLVDDQETFPLELRLSLDQCPVSAFPTHQGFLPSSRCAEVVGLFRLPDFPAEPTLFVLEYFSSDWGPGDLVSILSLSGADSPPFSLTKGRMCVFSLPSRYSRVSPLSRNLAVGVRAPDDLFSRAGFLWSEGPLCPTLCEDGGLAGFPAFPRGPGAGGCFLFFRVMARNFFVPPPPNFFFPGPPVWTAFDKLSRVSLRPHLETPPKDLVSRVRPIFSAGSIYLPAYRPLIGSFFARE